MKQLNFDIFDPLRIIMDSSDMSPGAVSSPSCSAPDFAFAFNDVNFSDRLLRIEILPDLSESKSDADGCDSLADWARNRKRRREEGKKDCVVRLSQLSIMDDIAIYGRVDKSLRDTVSLLRKNNVGVTVHSELQWNQKRTSESSLHSKNDVVTTNGGESKRLRTSQDKTLMGKENNSSRSKGKEKEWETPRKEDCRRGVLIENMDAQELLPTNRKCAGKENIAPQQPVATKVIVSKASLAQRKRRQLEKMNKEDCNLGVLIDNMVAQELLPTNREWAGKENIGPRQDVAAKVTVSKAALAQRKRRQLEKMQKQNCVREKNGGFVIREPNFASTTQDNAPTRREEIPSRWKGKEKEWEAPRMEHSILRDRNKGVVIRDAVDDLHPTNRPCAGNDNTNTYQAGPDVVPSTSKRMRITCPIPNASAPRTPIIFPIGIPPRTPITVDTIHKPPIALFQNELNSNHIPRDLEGEFSSTLPGEMPAAQISDVLMPSEYDVGLQNSQRHSLGAMNVECPFCGALHWIDEKLSASSQRSPLFGKCCLQGKVKLPPLNTPPPAIQQLYDGNDDRSKSFRRYTREYNACHAFTSLGFTPDDRVLAGTGPIPFSIHGELRHRTGSLLPNDGQNPTYAQLYIYDPDAALQFRCDRNEHLRPDVIKIIQETLLQYNAFSEKYLQAYEILCHPDARARNLPAYLHFNPATDRRRYNLPTTNEIAVILPGDETTASGLRDIVLHLRGNQGLMQISECHPAYLPLHYVLLFPRGELGWEPSLRQWDTINNRPTAIRLTQMQYYSYRLFERKEEYSTILHSGKLFQEFLVDAWAATEQNRLRFVRLNQGKLRAELYNDFLDFSNRDGAMPNQVGKPMILPSSHLGSPRHMFEIFQDSMAITRYHHHPDIFLTMTANPRWPEIKAALGPNDTSYDRPELVARVFELKRKALMERTKTIFGNKVAHVFTIEFQKRGLPHMHLLDFLARPDKIRTCEQVDRIVSAEIPDPKEDPLLFDTVMTCMIHGPCGIRNPKAPCMENGKCTKGYPKEFAESTTMDEDGYFRYRRTNNGRAYKLKNGMTVDNRDVVPYNPKLSREFNCHINVEVCAGNRCVKYIHKYIYKGHDRTTMIIGGVDEVQQYLEGRYIGPPEAAWRIYGHPLHEESPTIVRLALHLPGMHHVNFNPNESMEDIARRVASQVSTLTAYFSYYASKTDAPKITYQDFPQHFVWKTTRWEPRKLGFAIGRMYFASPNSGERFYLRLLLIHVKGPTSFEDLRTFNGEIYPTFKSACVARGLVEDDSEWVQCLREASTMQSGYQLRRLFSTILSQCSPVHPFDLWKLFAQDICDDLPHKINTTFFIPHPTTDQVQDYGLYLLNQLLLQSGRSLVDFPPMPQPTGDWSAIVGNRLIWEHRQLQHEAQQKNVEQQVASLNQAQTEAYSVIYSSILQSTGTTFFLNGGAGTGKTFLYNTIALKFRSLGHVVITVASSGIASLLLVGGRTAHSTFSIPLDVHDNSICSFSKQSNQAELFRQATLIIWDELPMQHRFCVEAVDRSLRDVRETNKPFGGITVVLGGDFRQILPVVTKGVRQQIVGASLRRSVIWNGVRVLTLNTNMRMGGTNPSNISFINFLTEIGSNPLEIVPIPPTIQRCQHVGDLLQKVYPNLQSIRMMTPEFLTERTILSARNDDVTVINNSALALFEGNVITYLAADKLSNDDESDRHITNRYPDEYLHSLDPPGLPPFKLELKVGSPIMLLRNLAPADGLCNGTRLTVVRCASRIIEARIMTGERAGNLVFIPRISLTPSSGELPFHMTRRQFPVRLAFAMTINKSQGQSVRFVGIDLRNPVFSHGQLYVALSRCTSADRISLLMATDAMNNTTNIVYPEVLLEHAV